ncbi:LysR family transcriptional regulator [Vibrio sp. 10N.261.51.F12]|uniref:LysR family transcriptional regulator n=1 Tax=Vibrio sp. 10N.261.51.F12 TaxID=3229679 RepID=UPI00354CD589
MDIKTLTTFVSVAKHKNFSAAARELHSVQPTVSRHVSELESELGLKLFLRTTHQVELTQAGAVLLPEAQAILANDKRVKTLVQNTQKEEKNHLKVGYLATACSFFLPNLVGQFLLNHSDVTTSLHEMTGQEQFEALTQNKIDVAFSRRQPKLDENLFSVEEIYADKMVAIVPAQHPLANQTELSMSDLEGEPFILFQRSEWIEMYEHILSLAQESGFTPNVTFHPENMRHLVTSVSSGLGISIAPQCIKFIADNNCVCIPISNVNLVLPLYIYYKRSGASSALEKFVSTCSSIKPDVQNAICSTH